MAANDKDTTNTDATGTTTGGADTGSGGQPTGMSITVPRMPAMPSLNELMEPKRLLWFGGLAAAGVVGVLEWPVVAAVGVGSYVAERFAQSDQRRGGQ